MKRFIWLRTSGLRQSSAEQRFGIEQWGRRAGVDLSDAGEIALAGVSGGDKGAAEIAEAFASIPDGAEVYAIRIERMGRAVWRIGSELEKAERRGVRFIFTDQPQLSTPKNPGRPYEGTQGAMVNMLRAMFLSLAENWLAEHSRKSALNWEKAREEGRNCGRGKFLSDAEKSEIMSEIEAGKSVRQTAIRHGIAQGTVRALRDGAKPKPPRREVLDRIAADKMERASKLRMAADKAARAATAGKMIKLAAAVEKTATLAEAAKLCNETPKSAHALVSYAARLLK